MIGRVAALVWDFAAWWLILSVAVAGLTGVIRKARARGKRLFVDEPTARVLALRPSTVDRSQDAIS